jgi:hypothetical protein
LDFVIQARSVENIINKIEDKKKKQDRIWIKNIFEFITNNARISSGFNVQDHCRRQSKKIGYARTVHNALFFQDHIMITR